MLYQDFQRRLNDEGVFTSFQWLTDKTIFKVIRNRSINMSKILGFLLTDNLGYLDNLYKIDLAQMFCIDVPFQLMNWILQNNAELVIVDLQ